MVLGLPLSAFAVTVTTTADTTGNPSGTCSLREAVEVANGTAHANCTLGAATPMLIDFALPASSVITLTSLLPPLTPTGTSTNARLVISGTGETVTIDGGGGSHSHTDMSEIDFGIFKVGAGVFAQIDHLDLTGVYAGNLASGAIYTNGGDVVVSYVNCHDNYVHNDAACLSIIAGTGSSRHRQHIHQQHLGLVGRRYL